MIGILDLPVEIRLDIFKYLFSNGRVTVNAGNQSEEPSLLSSQGSVRSSNNRSGQVLRTCKTIYLEAAPILYATTQFITINQAFAGRLPHIFGGDNLLKGHIQHLTWQLSCDFMKHLYEEDVHIDRADLVNVKILELKCQAESWRGSSCGAIIDDQAIVRGRLGIIRYAKMIQATMAATNNKEVFVIEDTTHLARGKLSIKVQRSVPMLSQNERLIEA